MLKTYFGTFYWSRGIFYAFGGSSLNIEYQEANKNHKTVYIKKIARLTIVAKGKNFLTRIWKLVSFRKSYFASLNWSKLVILDILFWSCNSSL